MLNWISIEYNLGQPTTRQRDSIDPKALFLPIPQF